MSDLLIRLRDPDSKLPTMRLRDMGDGTYAEVVCIGNLETLKAVQVENWPAKQDVEVKNFPASQSVIAAKTDSKKVMSVAFTSATHTGLVTAVNNYLASSTKKFVSIHWFAGGIATLLFYAIIMESDA